MGAQNDAILAYSKAKGWDVKNLKPEQVDEAVAAFEASKTTPEAAAAKKAQTAADMVKAGEKQISDMKKPKSAADMIMGGAQGAAAAQSDGDGKDSEGAGETAAETITDYEKTKIEEYLLMNPTATPDEIDKFKKTLPKQGGGSISDLVLNAGK